MKGRVNTPPDAHLPRALRNSGRSGVPAVVPNSHARAVIYSWGRRGALLILFLALYCALPFARWERPILANTDNGAPSAATPLPQCSGTCYYVSNSGSDSNLGTSPSSPWKTLSKVQSFQSNLQPGDAVLLQRGGVWYEQLDITRMVGNSGMPNRGSNCASRLFAVELRHTFNLLPSHIL